MPPALCSASMPGFLSFFLTNKAKKAGVDALPYSALESKQAEDALDALHTAGLDTHVK